MATWLIFTLVQLGILLIGFVGFLFYKLISKNKKLELALSQRDEIIRKQTEYLLSFKAAIDLSEQKIKEIDTAQTFQSDDEIGWYFSLIKQIQAQLFDYVKFIE